MNPIFFIGDAGLRSLNLQKKKNPEEMMNLINLLFGAYLSIFKSGSTMIVLVLMLAFGDFLSIGEGDLVLTGEIGLELFL